MKASPLRHQSLYSSLLHFLGAGIGVISVLFIYPKDLQLYGSYGFLTNTASILVPFVSLGLGSAMIKYFPHFKNQEKKHHGLLFFLLGGYSIGIITFILSYLIIYPSLVKHFTTTDPRLIPFLIYLIPLTIFYVLYEFTTQYSLNFYQSALPSFINTGMKLFLPLIFLLCVHAVIRETTFFLCVCLYFAFAIVLVLLFLKTKNQLFLAPDFQLWKHPERNEILRFAMYSIIGGTGAVIALRVDSMMVTAYVGAGENGKFSLAAFMSNAAFIPAAAILDILHPKISDIAKQGDLKILELYYQKSLRTMMATTFWLCACLYLCFPYLTQLMPNATQIIGLSSTLLFLLFARMIDAGTGANSHILSYSVYYKYETYLMITMAVINILLNMFFIPQLGITGAALSTFLSVSLFNIAKTLIVYFKIGIQPYTKQFFIILLIGIISFSGIYVLPLNINPILAIIIKGSVMSIFFWAMVINFQLVPELNESLKLVLEKFKTPKH